MRLKWTLIVLMLALAARATTMSAQTSVSLNAYGAFNGSTTGQGTSQSPANQAGGLIELRHIANPIFGFEATYSFNRANQTYTSHPYACPAFGCDISTESVSSNAHEITADWVPSFGIANFRPFGLLGAGLLLDVPSESQATVTTTGPCAPPVCPVFTMNTTIITSSSTSTSTRAVYVYGAGLDWSRLPHLGLRLQYRGNLYEAPNVTKLFSSTSAFTHTAEPIIGAYFKF